MVPKVEDQLEKWKTESVVLFGIEVRYVSESPLSSSFLLIPALHSLMSVCFKQLWIASTRESTFMF